MAPFERKLFAINGVAMYGPYDYREEPVPEVGTTLGGKPVRQGYPSFTFVWDFMAQEAMTALIAAYGEGEDPEKTVTYIDKATGLTRDMNAMMHEPVVGQRSIVYYHNVSVRFTRCIPEDL